ncbi:MAG: TonB-dependent receptor, partial [Erythrobacter sp.]|nr:TonB-dependent receptor [Erythrobacter sp.]
AEDGTFTVSGISGLTPDQVQAIGAATLNNVSGGTGIPQELVDAIRTAGTSAAPTNALDPNFEPPSQWRFSGSVDYEANLGFLGDGWNLGVDVIYSSINNGLEWTDLRSVETGATLPDGRPRNAILPGFTGTNTDILLTNTGFGESWNAVARFNKRWNSGFFLNGAYTYQDVTDQNPGTSSVAFSNYTNTAVGNDPNFAAQGISNYQRDHQFRLVAGYDAELFGDNNTRIELFYNVRSGQRYSYTFADQASGNNRSNVFGIVGRNQRNLLYVPNVSSETADPNVVYAPGVFTALQNFIQNSELNEYQGQVAPKNIGKTPWVHKLDLSLRQEVPFVLGGKLELLADVENVLNLINSDWGTIRQVGFPYTSPVVNVTCTNAACDQYSYSNFRAPNEATQINGSLWGVRFGVRLAF